MTAAHKKRSTKKNKKKKKKKQTKQKEENKQTNKQLKPKPFPLSFNLVKVQDYHIVKGFPLFCFRSYIICVCFQTSVLKFGTITCYGSEFILK